MAEAKHTPGKLTTPRGDGALYDIRIYADSMRSLAIATVWCEGVGDRDEAEANASRLVACWNACEESGINPEAVPELVKALENVVAEWDAERFEWYENRQGVLSGETPQPNTGATWMGAARAVLAKAKGEA